MSFLFGLAVLDAVRNVHATTFTDRDGMSSPKSLMGDSDDEDEGSGRSAPLRVIENYTDIVFRFIGPDASAQLLAQIELDENNDAYTPIMTNDSGSTETSDMTEITPLGIIKLGKLVHVGYDTIVYEIEGYPDILIKYQLQCTDLGFDIHPLLRDFWYMTEAHAWDIAPRPIFVSPPGVVCETTTGKCHGMSIRSLDLIKCRSEGGVARYMIMERAKGVTLHQLRASKYGSPRGVMNIPNALTITYNVINTLARLHETAGIVHGDIHTGNIVIDVVGNKLQLIDFGRAFRRTRQPEEPIYSRGAHHEFMNSLWQIEGYDWAARDDIIKKIQMLAHLMHPYCYQSMEHDIEMEGVDALCKWKREGDWFGSHSYDPLGSLSASAEMKQDIRDSLENMLTIGRSLGINQRIPYEALMSEVQLCAYLVRIAASVTSVSTTPGPTDHMTTTPTA